MKFTDSALKKLIVDGVTATGKPRKDRLLFDDECGNLGLRVTAKNKTFIVQWTDPVTKLKVREPLDVWGKITITQARDAARARAGAVAMGRNPKAEREHQRAAVERERAETALTLEKLVDEWSALHLAKMRKRYRVEAVRAIKHSLAHLLKRPVVRITKADAVIALDALLKAGKLGMAAKTHSYARAVFRWAEKRGKVRANPFQGLPISASVEAPDRVLGSAEVAEVWAAAGTFGYPWGPFYKLALLTLQRREEVAGMRWSELGDLDNRLWRIPGGRMKNGKPHDVHLSDAVVAILRDLPRFGGSDLVFTTTGKTPIAGFSRAKARLDAAIARDGEELDHWVLHDFRRTGISTLAKLGFDSIVVDKLLAHQPTKLSGVAAVYQRHDFARERAQALDAWAAHVTGQPVDNVLPMQRRA